MRIVVDLNNDENLISDDRGDDNEDDEKHSNDN